MSQRGRRLLLWTALLLVVALICGGLPYVYFRWSDLDEQRMADDEVGRYLSLVQEGDRSRADAMLCGGDDTTTVQLNDTFETDWSALRIDSVAIVSAWDWSSWVDGHGRTYGVRLTFADGSTAMTELVVEVIASEPCIGTEVPF
jgi:hypothetical protein